MENDIIDVELDDDSYSAVNRLLEIARKKTFATIDDILQVFPEANRTSTSSKKRFQRSRTSVSPISKIPPKKTKSAPTSWIYWRTI